LFGFHEQERLTETGHYNYYGEEQQTDEMNVRLKFQPHLSKYVCTNKDYDFIVMNAIICMLHSHREEQVICCH